MSLTKLVIGWLALCVAQLAASRVGRGEEGLDAGVMLTSKMHVEVHHEDDNVQNHVKQSSDDVLGIPVNTKLPANFAQLEEKAQAAGREVLAYLERMETAMQGAPIAAGMVGVGLVVLVAAFTIFVCMQAPEPPPVIVKDSRNSVEVWSRMVDDDPHSARVRRIKTILQERDDSASSGPKDTIGAMDLHNAMQDKRFAAELAQIGIANFSDSMAIFKMLSGAGGGDAVSIDEFVAACASPEGQLMKLMNELEEGTTESPPGFITENDLQNFFAQDSRLANELPKLQLTVEDAYQVFRLLQGASGKAMVNVEQFVDGCKRLKSQPRGAPSMSVVSGSSYATQTRDSADAPMRMSSYDVSHTMDMRPMRTHSAMMLPG